MGRAITFGSLFAGIGGLDLGFERLGMECKWQVEIEPYAIKVLEKHWPNVHRERDINECSKENLERVDIIAGGFPCQDISYAGRGAGLDGERSGLFFEAVRLVCELRPRVVVLENVAGLLTRGMDRVLGTLAEIGYDAEWHCIPAAAVGAPHIRDRVFVLAHAKGDGGAEREERSGRAGPDIDSSGDACEVQEPVPNAAGTRAWDKTETTSRQGREPSHAPEPEVLRQGDGETSTDGAESICADVPNADSTGLEGGQDTRGTGEGWTKAEQQLARYRKSRGGENWAIEPAVGRVVNGVPNRMDRLKGLGNAIVPQVAEVVGRIVLANYFKEN